MPILPCTVSTSEPTPESDNKPQLCQGREGLHLQPLESPAQDHVFSWEKANSAFGFRKRKLKTVSSHTWINNEWQQHSRELLVSSGPEGVSVQEFLAAALLFAENSEN